MHLNVIAQRGKVNFAGLKQIRVSTTAAWSILCVFSVLQNQFYTQGRDSFCPEYQRGVEALASVRQLSNNPAHLIITKLQLARKAKWIKKNIYI